MKKIIPELIDFMLVAMKSEEQVNSYLDRISEREPVLREKYRVAYEKALCQPPKTFDEYMVECDMVEEVQNFCDITGLHYAHHKLFDKWIKFYENTLEESTIIV